MRDRLAVATPNKEEEDNYCWTGYGIATPLKQVEEKTKQVTLPTWWTCAVPNNKSSHDVDILFAKTVIV